MAMALILQDLNLNTATLQSPSLCTACVMHHTSCPCITVHTFCMHVHESGHVLVRVRVLVRTCARACTCVCVCGYAYARARARVCMHLCMYVHVRTWCMRNRAG